MSDKKRKVPKLRFPGFTDAWEQRKLGEVGSLLKETVYPSKHPDKLYHEYSMPNYDNWKTPKVVKGNSMLSNRIKIKGNVLLVNKLNVHQRRIWNVQTSFEDSVASGEFLPYISEEVNLEMLSQVLLSDSSTLDLISLSSGSSNSQKRITPEEFMKYNVMFPTDIKEQNMIAKLLNSIDKHISLHQRKLDSVKMLKKSMLQKLFPKDGEKIPELRFPGFTDAWEQRKLGEISKRVTRKNSNLESTLPLTISAQYGLVDQITFFNKQIASKDMSGYYLIKKGEFAYNKSYSKDAPWGAVKRLDNYDNGVLSSLYIVFKLSSNIDSDFVAKYFETSNWHSEVSKRATEGARDHGLLNISASDFLSIEILIPNKTMEQNEIAQFLKLVDSTLSLHRRKLDHLKELKKGLLQQMFV